MTSKAPQQLQAVSQYTEYQRGREWEYECNMRTTLLILQFVLHIIIGGVSDVS